MKIAVLANPVGWHFQDLKRAAAEEHLVFACSYRQLSTRISKDEIWFWSGDHDLRSCDCLVVRAMPAGSLGQVVFRMDVLQQLKRAGILIVNSPRTIEASVDKYLSLALLNNAGIPVPRTGVCQTALDAMRMFDELGGDVVAKPLFGSQGKGLRRLNDISQARRYFESSVDNGDVIYLQEFIRHGGWDLRLLVVGGSLFSMKRYSDHWITNVSCGGIPRPHIANELETRIAFGAASAVHGNVIGVDLVYDENDQPHVVDVNSAPGWQSISATLQIDIARKILDFLETACASAERGKH
jgi:RimK family alpha-L-glutamate ligase